LLRGSVKLLENQRQAVKKASSVEHVRGVESKIIIDTRRIPDLQLKQLVKEQHLREVNIKVRKGTVTVRGPICGEADRERVLAQISSTVRSPRYQ
jgi:osmotically-inducible protein OsmY